ncbi:MAG TPA: fumarylacetoacetate hydrolase family protein [Thermoanaerobaculia bacterium]|nr:fumarylacetoacetate hydrolase family protein [Thermoanaerobaculia bacterium]
MAKKVPGTKAVPAAFPLRLATFTPKRGGSTRLGAVTGQDRVLDLRAAARRLRVKLVFDPADMVSLIASGAAGLAQVRTLVSKAGREGTPLEDVRLAAPIPVPLRNVYAVGWNYLEHFEEGKSLRDAGQTLPEHPVFFTKGTNAVNGPYDPIPYDPAVSTLIDWEVELAVVIGRKGKNVSEDRAMEHVFGFSVLNDTTARDVQQKRHGGQWFKGKSLDAHAPFGPWIVTAGGFAYEDLRLLTRVNGVVKQEGSTRQMYFKVPRIIAELSLGLTIEPGDIIATGTPPGIGHARKPPEYLKPGDVMETEIEGIGVLRNVITRV